jgi:hypothetical protein
VTLDPQGIITRVNLTAIALLGKPKKQLLDKVLNKYIARSWQDAFLEARHNASRTGEKQRLELQLIRNNGPPLWVRADLMADRDEREAVVQWRVVLLDVNREKEAYTKILKLNETLEQRVAERTAELEHRAGQIQQLALDLTRAEDRERRRFAAILHDDFQQETANSKLELTRISRMAVTDMHKRLAKLAQFNV